MMSIIGDQRRPINTLYHRSLSIVSQWPRYFFSLSVQLFAAFWTGIETMAFCYSEVCTSQFCPFDEWMSLFLVTSYKSISLPVGELIPSSVFCPPSEDIVVNSFRLLYLSIWGKRIQADTGVAEGTRLDWEGCSLWVLLLSPSRPKYLAHFVTQYKGSSVPHVLFFKRIISPLVGKSRDS